jgi:hypothetical protein
MNPWMFNRLSAESPFSWLSPEDLWVVIGRIEMHKCRYIHLLYGILKCQDEIV